MRMLIVAECVTEDQAQAAAPGCVTVCVDSFTAAFDKIVRRDVDVVVTPEAIGACNSGSGLDVARVANGYRVACVVVGEGWEDGLYGAALLQPDAKLCDALRRAFALRE